MKIKDAEDLGNMDDYSKIDPQTAKTIQDQIGSIYDPKNFKITNISSQNNDINSGAISLSQNRYNSSQFSDFLKEKLEVGSLFQLVIINNSINK